MKFNLNKFGTVGLFLTAILSPCCFPVFALIASALGLGSFEVFGGWTMWVFQAMVIISLAGLFISYRKHKNLAPLLIAIVSVVLIFYSYHFNDSDYWSYILYTGMAGILIATILNYRKNKMQNCEKTVKLESIIKCPDCNHSKLEVMPTNACAFFYECENCKTRLRPIPGDCCVYCSYGSVKCPPIQAGNSCC